MLRQKVMKGLAWQGTGRLAERLFRFAANLFLARLLAPEDFGAFAAILFPLAAIDSLAYLATGPVIIQSGDGTSPRFLRTVFTVNTIRGAVITLILLPVAPLVGLYFERPDLVPLFLLAATQPLLTSLQSPRIHVLARNMAFGRLAAFRVGAALSGALAGLGFALISPTPWALLVGQLFGVAVGSALSWVVAPMRPAWTFDRASWLVIRTYAFRAAGTPALIMLVAQAPAILLGRLDSLDALGIFSMNTRLAEFPVYVTLTVAGAVLIPAYSALQDDRQRLRRAWLKAWSGIGLLAAPCAVLLAWTGDALPSLVWGERYASAEPLMPVLALNGFLSCVLAVTGPLFWGVGRPSIDRLMQIARVFGVFLVGVLLVRALGMQGVAWGLTAGLLLALLIAVPKATSIVGATIPQLVRSSLPAVLSALSIGLPLVLVDVFIEVSGSRRVLIAAVIGIGFCLPALLALGRMKQGDRSDLHETGTPMGEAHA